MLTDDVKKKMAIDRIGRKFIEFLEKNRANGVIDFHLRIDSDMHFYIHPQDKEGDTLDVSWDWTKATYGSEVFGYENKAAALVTTKLNNMITIENIEGKKVKIEWVFDEVIDRHDSNWCEWLVRGTGDNNNEYTGNCQADSNNPESIHDDNVTDIEKEEKENPALKSFKTDFNEMFP